MTLEQIRAALPTHIMLTENVHIWQPDDEWRFDGVGWELISVNWWGKPVDIGCVRRPIPPHILDNQSWWCLYDSLAEYSSTGAYFEYDEHDKGWPLSTCLDTIVTGLRKFGSRKYLKDLTPALGGQDRIIKELEVGRLYDKWLLEQMEGV